MRLTLFGGNLPGICWGSVLCFTLRCSSSSFASCLTLSKTRNVKFSENEAVFPRVFYCKSLFTRLRCKQSTKSGLRRLDYSKRQLMNTQSSLEIRSSCSSWLSQIAFHWKVCSAQRRRNANRTGVGAGMTQKCRVPKATRLSPSRIPVVVASQALGSEIPRPGNFGRHQGSLHHAYFWSRHISFIGSGLFPLRPNGLLMTKNLRNRETSFILWGAQHSTEHEEEIRIAVKGNAQRRMKEIQSLRTSMDVSKRSPGR